MCSRSLLRQKRIIADIVKTTIAVSSMIKMYPVFFIPLDAPVKNILNEKVGLFEKGVISPIRARESNKEVKMKNT